MSADPSPSMTTFIRLRPEGLPEVLDLLVVGGGPGGTMTGFRAKELGLSALVIDYDDVLKRIRDYSKDKLILPSFGGGDAMRFPKGGELTTCLHFEPIDKDEMHQSWRALYREHGVPVQVGIELTALEREGDVWRARAFDHNRRQETGYAARHVALAIGRGVPRRFDVPGNTEGVAYRLDDPANYVGQPVCVVGGGTSAAEAVIAISNAKAQAEDPSTVYWSYRGTKLPRVSKALAEVFFEAYLGNGNIRYCPMSEPAAVVAGDDRREYLSIRIERRSMEGRPHETVHLEFPKEQCIACIGEDIPETFLGSLGVPMVEDPGKGRKRMLVTPLLETVQPDLYMVGDMLSQAYFETDDFDADPSGWRDVKHRGNIKSALRDGVLVAEVVAQKLAGATEIRVEIEDVDPETAAEPAATEEPAAEPPAPPPVAEPRRDGPPAAALDRGRRDQTARLVRLLPGGVEETEYPLEPGGAVTVGRRGCDAAFPDDDALADLHAAVTWGADGPEVRDEGGATGVFLRARAGEHTPLEPGAVVRAGRQFLVLGSGGLRHYDATGREVGRHPVGERAAILGRDAPDVVLDAADPSLSRRHLAVSERDGRVWIKDLKSVNGTWVKVRGTAPLADGDELKIGRQTFRLALGGGERERPSSVIFPAKRPEPPPRPIEAPAAAAPGSEAAAAAAPAAAGPSVTFQGTGQTFPVAAGQTLCDVAEANGVAINAECHAGICGSDPIRVVSGAEHLGAVDPGESETLEELCELDPGRHRLACMCKVSGPVVVEIVERS